MFKRAVKKGGKYFEALLQLAPSCESMADSCRSGELNSVSSVFVQYGPVVYGKSAKSVFVQYGPFVYGKSAKGVRAIWTIHL
jgi:hypothetical protein